MDVVDAIKNRRSIRRYKDTPVPLNILRKIVEAGTWAPTGANKQYWKYIIVNEPKVMKMVKQVSPMMWGISPAVVVVCQDLKRLELSEQVKSGYGECAGFPSQNILLAAHSLDLGTCAIGGFNKQAIKDILDIPDDLWPMLVINIGYPDEEPTPKPRRPLEEVVYLNSCYNPWVEKNE
jgi:nitroreductase